MHKRRNSEVNYNKTALLTSGEEKMYIRPSSLEAEIRIKFTVICYHAWFRQCYFNRCAESMKTNEQHFTGFQRCSVINLWRPQTDALLKGFVNLRLRGDRCSLAVARLPQHLTPFVQLGTDRVACGDKQTRRLFCIHGNPFHPGWGDNWLNWDVNDMGVLLFQLRLIVKFSQQDVNYQ